MTVAGVANSFPMPCWKLLRDVASLVGGGVCICDVSMLSGRGRADKLSGRVDPVFVTASGSGDDESLREGSTGGSGRVLATK